MDNKLDPKPIFLAGPTAAGKSAVAMELAERIYGEIISVDSMQVYRGMDIGTAKPSPDQQKGIPHHLIDVAGLDESFDAARFVSLAGAAVDGIRARGRVPIFCGGTGFYFKAFLHGLGQAPPSNPKIRAGLQATPLEELLTELEQHDPATFQKIDRQNPRRVIRALEVIRITGKPFSEQRADWQVGGPTMPGHFIGLTRQSGELLDRISRRVDEMFAKGLVRETEALLQRGLANNTTAMQALPGTIELVKIRTRQFAKRQLTWFRRQMRLDWITLEGQSSIATAIEQRICGQKSPPTRD
jgi:tRNA dimethylallyltransferase